MKTITTQLTIFFVSIRVQYFLKKPFLLALKLDNARSLLKIEYALA
jgi:hypothetical protein